MHAAVTLAPTMPAPGLGMLLWPDPLSCSYQFSIEAALDLHREKMLSMLRHKNVPLHAMFPYVSCALRSERCAHSFPTAATICTEAVHFKHFKHCFSCLQRK